MNVFAGWTDRNKHWIVIGAILLLLMITLQQLLGLFNFFLTPLIDWLSISADKVIYFKVMVLALVAVFAAKYLLGGISKSVLSKYTNGQLLLMFAGAILLTALLLTRATLGSFCIAPQAILPGMEDSCAMPPPSTFELLMPTLIVAYFVLTAIIVPILLILMIIILLRMKR